MQASCPAVPTHSVRAKSSAHVPNLNMSAVIELARNAHSKEVCDDQMVEICSSIENPWCVMRSDDARALTGDPMPEIKGSHVTVLHSDVANQRLGNGRQVNDHAYGDYVDVRPSTPRRDLSPGNFADRIMAGGARHFEMALDDGGKIVSKNHFGDVFWAYRRNRTGKRVWVIGYNTALLTYVVLKGAGPTKRERDQFLRDVTAYRTTWFRKNRVAVGGKLMREVSREEWEKIDNTYADIMHAATKKLHNGRNGSRIRAAVASARAVHDAYACLPRSLSG